MIAMILGFVVLLIVGFIVVIAMQPDDFRIARSATIPASPDAVFAQVNDLHNWQAWSPWAKMDPTAKNTYDGPAEGVGAGFAWDGNGKVGAGHMKILESRPVQVIRLQLDFERPFKGTHFAEFTFEPQAGGTLVTWTMTGKNGFVGKAIGFVMNCDKMIGGQFESGLADLSRISQGVAVG